MPPALPCLLLLPQACLSTICRAVSRQLTSLGPCITQLDFSGCRLDAAGCKHISNAAW